MTGLDVALILTVFVLAFAVVWLLKPTRRRGGMIDLTGTDAFTDDDDEAAVVFDWADPRSRDTAA